MTIDFTGSAEIRRVVVHAPGQPALNRQDGIDRPSFKNLSWRLHAGNGVRQRVCKPMSDIEPARAVEISQSVGIDRILKAPIVGRHPESVSERIAKNERNAVRGPLRHRGLQTVIIGHVAVGQPTDIAQVGKLAGERPGGLFCIRVRAKVRSHAVVELGSAGETFAGGTARDCRVSPTWAESADQLRLIDFSQTH